MKRETDLGAPPRVVLVTGGGKNIAAQIARQFAAKGDSVCLMARSIEGIQSVADEIRQCNGMAVPIACDVSSASAVNEAVEQFEDTVGQCVDVVVNSAMIRVQKPVLEMRLDEWESVLRVVLTGAFNTSRAVLPGMRAKGWGRIINMSGLAGQTGASNRAGIVTAKSGVIGFTKALAQETALDGITVNAVSPGIIDTERTESDLESMGGADRARQHYEHEVAQIPVGRMGRMEEVAHACLFLASDLAGFITGQVINVNGGRYM